MYKLYFFLLNLLIIHGLHSQDTNPFDKINRKQALYFTHLKRENGLPSNEVNCFIQDLQGYIWIGTSNGLVRFDGHDMKIFRSVPGDSSSLADNTVYSLLQSRDSLIWIGTSGGISVFKPGTGHIRNLPFVPPSGIPMVSSYIIRSLYEDHAGVLWAGTDHGLIRVSDNRKRIVQVPLWKPGNIRDRENIFDNVYSLLDDPRDETRLLVATGGGLVQFDKQSRLITNEYRKYISKNFLAPNDLFYDGLDGLWVCGWGMGLNRFDLKTETWQEFPVNKTTPVSILSISKKSRDELWLATTDNGLGLFNRRTGSFTFYRHDPSDPNSLLSNTVQEVCYFNNGEDLWIAGPDGISRQNRAYLSFQQISIPFKFSWINAFYRDVSKGKLYAGGYDCQGLFAWDEHLQRWDLIPGEQPAASNGLSVTHLFQDHSGVLWVATRQNLKYLDYGQNRLHLFRLADGKPLDLKDPVVYGLTEDKKGNLWVGTRYDGVFRIDPGRKQATRFRHIPGDQQSLAEGTHHIAIKEDKYNRIWIGNRNGISIYDPEQNCFLNFMMDTLRHYGIRKRWINSMEKDTLGRMWLGINGEGLVRLEEPQKGTFRFKLFHTGNGLNDQAIGWMTSDMEGNFWIVNQGLLRMNPYRETFQLIDTRNGLHENPGWASLIYADAEGNIYSPCSNGFEMKNIRDMDFSSARMVNLVMESIEINGSSDQGQNLLADRPDVSLKADENNLTFRYTAICFGDFSQILYEYQLEGYDKVWCSSGPAREARYTNLPPGRYTFRVRVSVGGCWMGPGKSVSFIIPPVFWKTWWFIMSCILLVAILAASVYRYRVRQLLKMERMRTRIASDLHDDVSSTLSSISILSEILSVQTIEPRASEMISEIGINSKNMLERIDDIIWTVNPKNDKFQNLGLRIREFALPLFEMKNIRSSFQYPEELATRRLSMDVRRNIYLIAKEAINNLVKYSGCGFAEIIFRENHSTLTMEIRDDGKGFDPAAITSRNGIKNMRQRAKNLNATLEIKSAEGEGTHIILIIDNP